jgi:hypothetical protein
VSRINTRREGVVATGHTVYLLPVAPAQPASPGGFGYRDSTRRGEKWTKIGLWGTKSEPFLETKHVRDRRTPPEVEASYAAQAAAEGVPLPEYLQHFLEERAPTPGKRPLSPAERADRWRRTSGNLPNTPLLSDEAISRESIYAERG